jgi:hypothetical protein
MPDHHLSAALLQGFLIDARATKTFMYLARVYINLHTLRFRIGGEGSCKGHPHPNEQRGTQFPVHRTVRAALLRGACTTPLPLGWPGDPWGFETNWTDCQIGQWESELQT